MKNGKVLIKCESAVCFISVFAPEPQFSAHIHSLAVLNVFVSVCITDNQECGDSWREDEDKLPGHENLTEKDVELFRHIQELALQVRKREGEVVFNLVYTNENYCSKVKMTVKVMEVIFFVLQISVLEYILR